MKRSRSQVDTPGNRSPWCFRALRCTLMPDTQSGSTCPLDTNVQLCKHRQWCNWLRQGHSQMRHPVRRKFDLASSFASQRCSKNRAGTGLSHWTGHGRRNSGPGHTASIAPGFPNGWSDQAIPSGTHWAGQNVLCSSVQAGRQSDRWYPTRRRRSLPGRAGRKPELDPHCKSPARTTQKR
jgi:hypothetical protein